MEAAVAVGLGDSDIVFEAVVVRCPQGMNNAQYFVAVGNIINDDTKSEDVVNIVEFTIFVAHFLPDTVEMFEATFDVVFDADFV